ncbi:MAG TPA: hydroxymethylglutaryl-CoA lyase [Roseomonas sp.]|nr:hydroxymethylglutaryl-CoA lyase [Roseomonas sp.]
MSLPRRIEIREEGPREGFQFEKGEISTAHKLELIHALAETGLKRIQTVSFVDPRRVPGMADAEAVCAGLKPPPGVAFGALWLNAKGFLRALVAPNLTLDGSVSVSASEVFGKRNQNRDREQDLAAAAALMALYAEHRIPFARATIMAAFGCNFQGEVPVDAVLDRIEAILSLAGGAGLERPVISLADTMAWATPLTIRRVVGAVCDKWPDLEISLHLHDTRGMAMVNAWEGLRMGVARFDAAIAGLGGCPFAKHAGAAGNLCTEDLALLCAECGVETGLDLDRLIEAGRLAEDVVGHSLPGRVKQGGRLAARS